MVVKVGVETLSIFAGRHVVGEGVSHVTQRRYIVPRDLIKEVGTSLIPDSRFEGLLFTLYRQPLVTSEGS